MLASHHIYCDAEHYDEPKENRIAYWTVDGRYYCEEHKAQGDEAIIYSTPAVDEFTWDSFNKEKARLMKHYSTADLEFLADNEKFVREFIRESRFHNELVSVISVLNKEITHIEITHVLRRPE